MCCSCHLWHQDGSSVHWIGLLSFLQLLHQLFTVHTVAWIACCSQRMFDFPQILNLYFMNLASFTSYENLSLSWMMCQNRAHLESTGFKCHEVRSTISCCLCLSSALQYKSQCQLPQLHELHGTNELCVCQKLPVPLRTRQSVEYSGGEIVVLDLSPWMQTSFSSNETPSSSAGASLRVSLRPPRPRCRCRLRLVGSGGLEVWKHGPLSPLSEALPFLSAMLPSLVRPKYYMNYMDFSCARLCQSHAMPTTLPLPNPRIWSSPLLPRRHCNVATSQSSKKETNESSSPVISHSLSTVWTSCKVVCGKQCLIFLLLDNVGNLRSKVGCVNICTETTQTWQATWTLLHARATCIAHAFWLFVSFLTVISEMNQSHCKPPMPVPMASEHASPSLQSPKMQTYANNFNVRNTACCENWNKHGESLWESIIMSILIQGKHWTRLNIHRNAGGSALWPRHSQQMPP